MIGEQLTLEQVRALVTRAPFHQWLGLRVIAIGDDSIEIRAKWREEWVVNSERGYTHGGVIAALIDLAADWAMVRQTGRGVPTIDLRVDYHRPTIRSDLVAHGKVVRAGGQFATAEAHIFDLDGKLIASGRGTYLTAPPKAP
jgi:uncharacterized protein (TIGR00369 family)